MLDIGENIRYSKIGSGKVINHVEREFEGSLRVFAVLEFPHKDMTMQLPIGDPIVQKKISPVLKKSKIKKSLEGLTTLAEPLPRTWDVREQIGERVLNSNNPEQWFMLLGSYAYAEGSGIKTVASDLDLLRSIKELVAAELACANNINYIEAVAQVDYYFNKAVSKVSDSEKKATSYAGIAPK